MTDGRENVSHLQCASWKIGQLAYIGISSRNHGEAGAMHQSLVCPVLQYRLSQVEGGWWGWTSDEIGQLLHQDGQGS